MSLLSFGRLAGSAALAAAALFTAAPALMPAAGAQSAASAGAEPARVMLFGDSTTRTSYLPAEDQHHRVLERKLKEVYPGQPIEVRNWADNGETIARYLLRGVYDKHQAGARGVDVAIIRFGVNDQKITNPAEFEGQLLQFIKLLQADFPGVKIILETGVYVDYPAHYSSDRNKTLNPYWEAARKLAAENDFPLIEYYGALKREAEAGNWDVRIRNIRKKGEKGVNQFVFDASEDAGKENDRRWFSDIHPNSNGVAIAVAEEAKLLREVFPERLPTGQKVVARAPHGADFYAEYLQFDPQRLNSRWPNPERDLQSSSHAKGSK